MFTRYGRIKLVKKRKETKHEISHECVRVLYFSLVFVPVYTFYFVFIIMIYVYLTQLFRSNNKAHFLGWLVLLGSKLGMRNKE